MEFGTLHLSNKKHKNNWRCSAKAAVFPNRELSLCQCCKLAAALCLRCMYDVWITQISYLTSCNIKFVGWEPEKPGRLKLPQGPHYTLHFSATWAKLFGHECKQRLRPTSPPTVTIQSLYKWYTQSWSAVWILSERRYSLCSPQPMAANPAICPIMHQEKKNLPKYFNTKFIATSQDEYKWPLTSTVTRGAQSGGPWLPDIDVYG